MRWHVGTSGFSYKEWKGPFYPADLPQKRWLAFYAERLSAVEINNTFYRSPRREMLEGWAAEVGERFTFVLKAPQRITHKQRLVEVDEPVGWLWEAAQGLGPHLGPILFQLPPFARADVELLRRFLGALPAGLRAVLEFRHPSWSTEPVHEMVREALREHGAAWCTADTGAGEDAENDTGESGGAADGDALVSTADFGYVRLRREAYDDAALAAWSERIRAAGWSEAFVFFKHEDAGTGPRLAARLRELVGDA
jgi:uncharacterized protein YecE (DUF72 family)